MKKLSTYILASGLLICSTGSFAQDVHFSHMEYSPLTLNPALAGANSPMQGIVNYRSQWNSVAVPYSTIAASYDARFNENKRDKKGIVAGGINFFNDQAGDLRVNTTNVNLNLAYHLMLDRNSTLGIGIYSGFGQRSISPGDGKWASQYTGSGFNTAIESGETFNNASFGYFDAGTGILYRYASEEGYMTQNKGMIINAGFAMYHVSRPRYSYMNQEDEQLNMRASAFVNAEIGIKNTRGAVLPGIYYQRQGTAQEIFMGAYYRYNLNEGSKVTGFSKPMSLSVGLFGRVKDAMVAKMMFSLDQYSAGFAYDINISSLTEVSRARGGFELFLRYNMGQSSGTNRSRI
jgi:type IX secretion system PorP/SprF family membrane protein